MIRVELCEWEARYATFVGKHRQRFIDKKGFEQRGVCGNSGEVNNIMGACGELALSKWLNVYWHPHVFDESEYQNRKNIYDVGGQVEVRCTGHKNGRLPVKSIDRDGAPYVLVIQAGNTYTLVGWLYGHEAKQARYIREYYKLPWVSYFVPQSELRSMESLRDLLQRGQSP